ncbi:MAG: 6,7-dimethyl-8-ribityllumazine synthase [Gemmatimonadota bacterium]
MIEYNAPLTGSGRRIGIVVSRFNELVTKELLEGARDCLLRHDVADDSIVAAWVPGAWEIPSALAKMRRSGEYDALIALGAVIRGATPHFEYVSSGVTSGVARLAATGDVPVIFGVLTTDTLEQAFERAGTKAGNKGWEAALAALEMANLFDQLEG